MKDYKKYFYMAELLALVDLSLVSMCTSMHVHHHYGQVFLTHGSTVSRLSRWECSTVCGEAVS